MAPNRKPIGFYLSSGWLFVCLFMSLFGGILPLPKWDDYDFDYTGSGLFTPGHILAPTSTEQIYSLKLCTERGTPS